MSKIVRVVLYKHGMACFERLATVDGDAHLTLSFRHDEMDDALKSLAVADSAGGQLVSVAYDPHPDLNERLDDVLIELPRGGGMVALLGQLVGAEVKVSAGDEKLHGRILGIEEAQTARGETAFEVEFLSLMVGAELLRVPISEVRRVTPVDPALQRDLLLLLSRKEASRRNEERQVVLDLRGKGARDVSVTYVVPATVWKTSYRVVFFDDDKPRLIGFALVDNDSQDDWEDVELSLVSGLPISFTHDLYSPRRRARPHVRVETEAPVAPPVLEGATYEMDDESEAVEYMRDAASLGLDAVAAPAPRRRGRAAMEPQAAVASVKVETRTQELGNMFRYDVATPVTIRRGHSALVPIVSEELGGEVVAVYNEGIRVGNPLTSFKLDNTTDLTLEGGPATVYRDGEYAGEAMLETMRPGDQPLVPFSVELGCKITTVFGSLVEAKQEIIAKDGYLHHTTWTRATTTYTLNNTTKRDLKIYLDHPADRSADYVDSPVPEERTESFDRFIVEVTAHKQGTFKLVQRRRSVSTIWINPDHMEHHLTLVQTIGNAELGERLRPLAKIARALAGYETEKKALETEAHEFTKQHKRIRENLKTLGLETKRERDLRERYVSVLDGDETRIDEVKRRLDDLVRSIADLRKRFDEKANTL